MKILALVAVPALALVTLSGCSLAARGPATSQERDIDAATAVELNTSGNLVITEGAPSLTITAPAAVLDRLTSSVVGGVLVLGTTPGTPGILLGKISYELTLPSLEGLEITGSGDVRSDVPTGDLELEISGSGDLDVSSIDAETVSLRISGSGDVELEGRTDELTISIDGAADVRTDELEAARVTIDLDGAGDLVVAASDALDVSISGAGSVEYVGRPEVSQDISGVGEVSER